MKKYNHLALVCFDHLTYVIANKNRHRMDVVLILEVLTGLAIDIRQILHSY
ncbi:hypothetical protein EDB96_0740 [Flavobacterium sp. S87F.05.LMB.W.Kidney.N]|nr:hypothetical protein EDB96_0740 [Flavobacterium sp. S87F.05.LMB.W.Kidney.N]